MKLKSFPRKVFLSMDALPFLNHLLCICIFIQTLPKSLNICTCGYFISPKFVLFCFLSDFDVIYNTISTSTSVCPYPMDQGRPNIWGHGNWSPPSSRHTLTGMTSCCPDSFIKTTPPPPGYPWVSGGQEGPPQQRIRGLALDHQNIKDLSPKTSFK